MPQKNYSFIPILATLKKYSKSLFWSDLSAGMIVGVMLIPQGMAYAVLAGLPAVYGLYGGLVPLFIFALLGTSRHLSVGPVAISGLLMLAGISQLAEPFSQEYIELVILSGLLIGICNVLLGVFRIGFLMRLISHPVLIGFSSAAAVIIVISQFSELFSIAVPRFEYSYETVLHVIGNLKEMHLLTFLVCVISICTMLGLKKINRSIPSALLVVAVSILLCYIFRLDQFGLAIVGNIPDGLPSFSVPSLSMDVVIKLIPVVITVTIIGLVESIGLAKIYEAKHGDYRINTNQEFLALGVSKIVGSMFLALPTSGSFTRTAINSDAGGKTTVSSVFAAILVGLTLLFLTPLFYYLPKVVLVAIILLAVRSLFDVKGAIHLWHIDKRDFFIALITFITTLILGIEIGVLIGVVVSLFFLLFDHLRSKMKPNNPVISSLASSYPEPDLYFKFNNKLVYLTVDSFREQLMESVDSQVDVSHVVLDASGITGIDSSGYEALVRVRADLRSRDITFSIEREQEQIYDYLNRVDFINKIDE